MSLWEYKVISSGKGGFATPALLEKFLNDLGRDEWEIVEFRAQPDNSLAFSGLARRSTQRDWTLQDAAAAAAKAEAEKLRAEFEAKFKAATGTAPAEERAPSFLEEKVAPDDGFRKPVDTSRDDDPEIGDDEKDDWDKLTAAEEDELPTFFEAIRPHMRRNQRGPGQSVGVDYLAKKWEQSEDDLKGALIECGFEVPEDEDAKPVYVEYDGDLFWLNMNRRGELWINTKEKPRPMFKPVKAARVELEDEAKSEPAGASADRGSPRDGGNRRPERPAKAAESEAGTPGAAPAETAAPAAPGAPLPEGHALLERIRPLMRRNRRGPGGSGSTSFLARALKTNEDDLKTAFTALGLTMPAGPNDKPVNLEIGDAIWWLNLDSRGGLWINGREKRDDDKRDDGKRDEDTTAASGVAAPAETSAGAANDSRGDSGAPSALPESVPAGAAADAVPAPEVAPAASAEGTAGGARNPVLAGVRLLLKETRTGSIAAPVDALAEQLAKPSEEFLGTLVSAGLVVPEKPREKPVFVEQAGEIFWLNRNAKGELWLNAKASKFPAQESGGAEPPATGEGSTDAEGERKPARRGGRSRKKAE